jgi:zinc protease
MKLLHLWLKPVRWSGFFLLAACLLWWGQAQASTTQQFMLPNGMTLIVQPDQRAPTVLHMVWVRAGSIDEVDGRSGLAHIVEHMLFKGTPTLAEGEFSRRVATMGGRDNAFTSRDVTVYHQQIPSHRLADVMKLEADRFANNRWPNDAFDREMEVIKEERRQRVEESPQSRMFEVFNAQAWMAHPYRRPIIGWMSDLDSMTAADVKAFYRQWYMPANAAVVVVGDVDPQAVYRMALQHYGRIPARAVPERKPQTEPEQHGVRRVHYHARVQQPLLVMGYKAPKLQHPASDDEASRDAMALMLLSGVLNGHSAARLERELVQTRVASQVSAHFGITSRGPLMFSLSGSPAQGVSPEALEQALKAAIARVAEQGVSEAELNRVKNQWAASEVFKLDSMFAQARELGTYWALGWPLNSMELLMQRLRQVQPADVQRVAGTYFADAQLTVGLLLPEVQP